MAKNKVPTVKVDIEMDSNDLGDRMVLHAGQALANHLQEDVRHRLINRVEEALELEIKVIAARALRLAIQDLNRTLDDTEDDLREDGFAP